MIINKRIFVEKKDGFQTEANALKNEINEVLKETITSLRLINVYDVFNIENDLLEKSLYTVFGEIVTNNVSLEIDLTNKVYISYEYLPGQYDLRADSVVQCLSLLDEKSNAIVKSSRIIIIEGASKLEAIEKYLINPIECRKKDLLELVLPVEAAVKPIEIIKGFRETDITTLHQSLNLAMRVEDLAEVVKYFKNENRDPSEVEIKMLDAYWSDHCRHSTFETELTIDIEDEFVKKSYELYLNLRNFANRNNKPITLMDMATINSKVEQLRSNLNDLEISEENNACSTFIDVDVDGEIKKYILMFKNETHNHPTEVEPYGGASTCIGGAIRDPMSGRSYVYQAARITGAANILEDVSNTLEGKLPQRFISKTAALGNSSYGNQIGLANTLTKEIFHPGFVAKRMELGAVVGCNLASNIVRKTPVKGDLILLLGGLTGRDGIGGAVGSSKEHNINSLETSAAEVQKGNAPEERKLVRLYRNPKASKLIKKSNDFGAGGVSVAIGELADGLEIYLDKVPLKYSGLNEAEIALSESQERMAVVISPDDLIEFVKLVNDENCSATVIAKVTDTNRLIMKYNDKEVVNIKRSFINTNGVRAKANVMIPKTSLNLNSKITLSKENILNVLSSINVCSQKGLVEMFDSTIGANTVLYPYGGVYQLTENQTSVSKIPVIDGDTTTVSILAYGYDPYLMSESPYYGSMYAVIESLTKIVCVGGDYKTTRLTFQEYFEKLGDDPLKWGKPTQSLLGAIEALNAFNLASVGGKDSMSGTFKDLNVPPTLVSFAVNVSNSPNIISSDFKKYNNYLYLVKHNPINSYPNFTQLKENFDFLINNIKNKTIVSSYSLGNGGLVEALFKCAFGNKVGFNIEYNDVFSKSYGSVLIESTQKLDYQNAIYLGTTEPNCTINNITIDIEEAIKTNEQPLSGIYPITATENKEIDLSIIKTCSLKPTLLKNKKTVNVLIPVFPGTNCDYDVYKAFTKANANCKLFIFKNNQKGDVLESIKKLKEEISQCDILALAGGFSAGDEPDGSGKYIANVLNNSLIREEVIKLKERKGLILGICNGFQALVKAGFLPEINEVNESSPTLFKNDSARHISHIVRTKVISTKSPWMSGFNVNDTFLIPVSHGEGKFIVSKDLATKLFDNGMVACVYCDYDNNPTMDPVHNVNGSFYAIEAITSSDGLILGKMGHSERMGDDIHKNIYGNKTQDIFKNAVNYFLGEDK